MISHQKPLKGNGFIYILSNPSLKEGLFKIGRTSKPLADRLRDLNNTSTADDFRVERVFEIQGRYLNEVEAKAHQCLKRMDKHKSREFFSASLAECESAVMAAINQVRNR